MDEYQVRTWQGWHHHMALTLIAIWFLIGETHRGQQLTPALTLPQVRYGLSLLLLEVFGTPGIDSICRQVHRQCMRNELARFYHHRTRTCLPPRKWRRDIQWVYLECGNSGKSNQTVSILAFVLHRFGVCVHPFTKSQRTW